MKCEPLSTPNSLSKDQKMATWSHEMRLGLPGGPGHQAAALSRMLSHKAGHPAGIVFPAASLEAHPLLS